MDRQQAFGGPAAREQNHAQINRHQAQRDQRRSAYERVKRVVEEAAGLVGSSIDIEVANTLRTSVGRLLFARPAS